MNIICFNRKNKNVCVSLLDVCKCEVNDQCSNFHRALFYLILHKTGRRMIVKLETGGRRRVIVEL
jgi:hypothetical protein